MLKVGMGGRLQAEPGFWNGGGESRCDGEVGGVLRIRESVVPVKDFNFSQKPTQL